MFDILIVGSGINGMLTACELVKAGANVTIVDQGKSGQESSWAGGGIISPLYPWRYPDSISALARWSQQHYPDLIDEINQDTGLDAELCRSGLLVLNAEDEISVARQWAEKWQKELYIVENKEIIEIEGKVNPAYNSDSKGIWMPTVMQVRNPRLVKTLKKYLENHKVRFIEQVQVDDILVHSGKVTGVSTSNGNLNANRVIVAGGAWSSILLQKTGIQLDVEPVKGQMILLKTKPGYINRIILSQDRYVIPRKDGRILVGSSLEYTGFNKDISSNIKEELYLEGQRIIPGLEAFEIEHHWAGLRPGSRDGIPFIGSHPEINGLYINTGQFRNGVVLGPASARLLADIVLQRNEILSPLPYSLAS